MTSGIQFDKIIGTMNIPLDQFEQIIDDTILKRGLNYFRKGFVEEPEELSHGYFEAILQGSEPYRVTVTVQDRKEVIARARYLLVQSNRDHSHYYKILKSQVDANEWPSFTDDLIKQISDGGRWNDSHFLAWICIEEERWKTLLEVCGRNFTLHGIQEYEKYLADPYPEELAGIYRQGILELLERHTDRKHYQEATRYIWRMKKIGAAVQGEELTKELQKKYPMRRALMEELERI